MIYEVKFDMHILYHSNDGSDQSLIRLTNGADHQKYRNGIPAVYVSSDREFKIQSAVNGDTFYEYKHNLDNTLRDEWINVAISQTLKNSKHAYQIKINNSTVHSVINAQPSEFNDVMVYATVYADPVVGSVKELSIVTGTKI